MSDVTLEDLASAPVTGNKRQLADALGVHDVTMDRWLRRFGDAVPCIQRGALGRAYLFDIPATVAFFAARQEEERTRQSDKDEQLAQLALPIELPGAEGLGVLSLKDQLTALKLRTMQREEAEKLKLLVPAAAMRDAITVMFSNLTRRVSQRLQAECRERGLPDEVFRKLHAAIASAQDEAIDELDHQSPPPDTA